MAAPSFNLENVGATDAGGAWTFDVTAGNPSQFIIVQILQDGATSGALTSVTFANVHNLAGAANSMDYLGAFPVGSSTAAYQHLWIGRRASSGATSISGSNSTSEDLYCRSYTFVNVSAGTTLAEVIENVTAGSTVNSAGTSDTAADASVTTLGPDRLALNFVAVNDDNAIAEFAGQTGGAWVFGPYYAESTGTDGAVCFQYAYPFAEGAFAAGGVLQGMFGSAPGASQERFAQSFSLAANKTITEVVLAVSKIGSATDNLIVEIQTDAAGVPSGTVVGSGASVNMTEISTSRTIMSFSVNAPVSASTTYWVVTRRSGARNIVSYPLIECSAADIYANGNWAVSENNGTWVAGTLDLHFGLRFSGDTGYTIDGGTASITASDAWGVVGFALIGTTPTPEPRVPRATPYPQLLAH